MNPDTWLPCYCMFLAGSWPEKTSRYQQSPLSGAFTGLPSSERSLPAKFTRPTAWGSRKPWEDGEDEDCSWVLRMFHHISVPSSYEFNYDFYLLNISMKHHLLPLRIVFWELHFDFFVVRTRLFFVIKTRTSDSDSCYRWPWC